MATKVPLPSRGLRGVDERTPMRTAERTPLTLALSPEGGGKGARSASGEPRRALLEERLRAFLVIEALERLEAEREQALGIGVGDALEVGLDLRVGVARRQRCSGGCRLEMM